MHDPVDIAARNDNSSSACSTDPFSTITTCSDGVENAIRVLEDHPSLNAGKKLNPDSILDIRPLSQPSYMYSFQ